MEFTIKQNDSLIDMEKRMQNSCVYSPSSRQSITHDRRRSDYSFRKGPTSLDLLRQAKRDGNKPMQKTRRMLSRCGAMFLVMAFLQAIVVTAIQTAIAVLGDFRGGQLEQYVPCVMESYNASNLTLPPNSTFPSFGSDKEIYVVIFIFLVVYNLCLCLYALLAQRIVEVWSFVFINFLLVIYASVQVYQFRGFGEFCDQITFIGWLAMGNVAAVLLFNIMFCVLALQVHAEFGWKVYKFVNCNPALRFYYRNYEIFLSIVKIIVVFTIAFLVGQAALILSLNDYEFWMSYPFILGMIALFFYAFFMVRRESHIAFLVLLVVGMLLVAYYCFKIFRYVTRSCPSCKMLDEEIDDRREDFQHLTMMASLNMIITLGFLLMLIRVWLQFGNGLADHFYIHGYWFDRLFKKKPLEIAYLNSVGTGALFKQKSSAALLHERSLEASIDNPSTLSPTKASANINRNSSLDERDYADYVFTPTSESKPPLGTANSLHSPDCNPINRTFSLPPILENPSSNKTKNSKV